jgi:hypothetical protein
MIINALSVDVEEYYDAAIFRNGTNGLDARRFESRVEESLERLLRSFRCLEPKIRKYLIQ